MEIEPFPAEIQGPGQEKLGIQSGVLNPMPFQTIGRLVQGFQNCHLQT
jgi:hypothetical protein